MKPCAFPSRTSRGGFTLVEVLAALTLAALVLPVAMRGVSLALTCAGRAKRQAEAAVLAEAKLAELVVTEGWQAADLSGDFEDEAPDYAWRAEVNTWDTTTLRRLDVSVYRKLAGPTRAVTLTTLVQAEGE